VTRFRSERHSALHAILPAVLLRVPLSLDRDPYASNPHAQELRRDKSLPGTEAASNDLLLDEENGGDKPAKEEEKRCMTVVVRGSRRGVPDWCESSLTFLVQFLDQFLISNRYL
jgi:hypothetical protein